jgi:hypothetical protein
MSEERDEELEREDTWDYEREEVRGPVRATRVVVSVAFRRDDFEPVSQYAERIGKKISEFIREAAIEKAVGEGGRILTFSSGGSVTLWGTQEMLSVTRVLALRNFDHEEAVITTA